jgi:hypothetical protein
MHATPTDFAFGGKPLAKVLRYVARTAECGGDGLLMGIRSGSPIGN